MPHTITFDDHPFCTCGRSVELPASQAMLARAASQAGRALMLWRQRSRQRQALANLDSRMLRDVGKSWDEALREVAKPFWRR